MSTALGLGLGLPFRTAAGFNPASLFAAGEQGAWYDPSDLTTLFQDAAGTTPTTMETRVRLMLDKSGRGNHATAPSDASSPILRARYNRLERTEEISNVYWTKSQLTSFAASGVTPNGVTAFNLVPNTNVDAHRLWRPAINIAGPKTMRVVAKANGYNFLVVTDPTSFSAGIDLTTGTQFGGTGTAVVTSLGNGWWEIEVSGTATASTSFSVEPLSSASFLAYAGDGVRGVLVGEFDDRFTADAALNIPAYQSITTATSYDTNGFPPYLAADGTDDSFSTASIDFTGTDEMTVFAGVSGFAADKMIFETSVDATVNDGSVYLYYGATTLEAASRGTIARFRASAPYTNPATLVVTMASSISAPVLSVALNGGAASSTTASQGTGNFGNYPLFIGRRNNSGLPFNGRIYSLIIRGAATTTPLIASTEQWVNQKMRGNLLPVDFNFLTTAGGDQLTTADGDPLYTSPIYP